MGSVDRIERIIPTTLPIQSAHQVARREDEGHTHQQPQQGEDTVELEGDETVEAGAGELSDTEPESEIVGSLDIAV
jgi:hypothetical protein